MVAVESDESSDVPRPSSGAEGADSTDSVDSDDTACVMYCCFLLSNLVIRFKEALFSPCPATDSTKHRCRGMDAMH